VKVAYQGAPGAYSEIAAGNLFPAEQLVPQRTFDDVFAALQQGDVRTAVVPVENTHAGAVVDVYDLLRTHSDFTVLAEAVVRVSHCLLALPGTKLDDIRTARSHPQALSQVDTFLREHGIRPEVAYDTAGAAQDIARGTDRSLAAVASRRAASHYGLAILAEAIETTADNYTRFFAIAHADDKDAAGWVDPAAVAGPAKTSLVYATKNVPGALLRSLQPFAVTGIQLTKIESRPSRNSPWDYVFYLDFEGDPASQHVADALEVMRASCAWVRVLGTYRAATSVVVEAAA
jgi:prephenate dehydratase